MGEELTTKELMDLRVILVRFMADKKAHKKIPRLVGRAPKLWDTVDRMYKYKLKGKEDEGLIVESFMRFYLGRFALI